MHGLLFRLRTLFRRHAAEGELDDELRFHLERQIAKYQILGMSEAEAERRARLEFGGLDQVKDECREARGINFVETLLQDLRYTTRTLLHSPAFTSCAVLTLALAVGANTAIFSIVNSVLLSPLPYPNPQELLAARQNDSRPNLKDIQRLTNSFASSGGVNINPMDFTGKGEPSRVHAAYVDAGLLATLGVQPMLGRWISADEDVKGGPRNIVVNYPFWRDFLGGDPHVLGKSIRLSGNGYTVIGVMPSGFALPQEPADIFVSLWVAYPEAAPDRDVHFMHTYWRLKPGVTLTQAQAEIAQVDRRLAEQFPDGEKGRGTLLVPLHEWLVGNIRPALLILFGSVGLVLLIACANFAMLLMARSVARQPELMIRASLGASNSRLIRQRLTESTLLGSIRRSSRSGGCKDRNDSLTGIETSGPAALHRNSYGPAGLPVRIWGLAADRSAIWTSARLVRLPWRYRGSLAGKRSRHRQWHFAQSIAQLPGHRGACPGTHIVSRCRAADQRLSAFALRQSGLQSPQHHDDVPSAAWEAVSRNPVRDEFPSGVAGTDQRPSGSGSGNDFRPSTGWQ